MELPHLSTRHAAPTRPQLPSFSPLRDSAPALSHETLANGQQGPRTAKRPTSAAPTSPSGTSPSAIHAAPSIPRSESWGYLLRDEIDVVRGRTACTESQLAAFAGFAQRFAQVEEQYARQLQQLSELAYGVWIEGQYQAPASGSNKELSGSTTLHKTATIKAKESRKFIYKSLGSIARIKLARDPAANGQGANGGNHNSNDSCGQLDKNGGNDSTGPDASTMDAVWVQLADSLRASAKDRLESAHKIDDDVVKPLCRERKRVSHARKMYSERITGSASEVSAAKTRAERASSAVDSARHHVEVAKSSFHKASRDKASSKKHTQSLKEEWCNKNEAYEAAKKHAKEMSSFAVHADRAYHRKRLPGLLEALQRLEISKEHFSRRMLFKVARHIRIVDSLSRAACEQLSNGLNQVQETESARLLAERFGSEYVECEDGQDADVDGSDGDVKSDAKKNRVTLAQQQQAKEEEKLVSHLLTLPASQGLPIAKDLESKMGRRHRDCLRNCRQIEMAWKEYTARVGGSSTGALEGVVDMSIAEDTENKVNQLKADLERLSLLLETIGRYIEACSESDDVDTVPAIGSHRLSEMQRATIIMPSKVDEKELPPLPKEKEFASDSTLSPYQKVDESTNEPSSEGEQEGGAQVACVPQIESNSISRRSTGCSVADGEKTKKNNHREMHAIEMNLNFEEWTARLHRQRSDADVDVDSENGFHLDIDFNAIARRVEGGGSEMEDLEDDQAPVSAGDIVSAAEQKPMESDSDQYKRNGLVVQPGHLITPATSVGSTSLSPVLESPDSFVSSTATTVNNNSPTLEGPAPFATGGEQIPEILIDDESTADFTLVIPSDDYQQQRPQSLQSAFGSMSSVSSVASRHEAGELMYALFPFEPEPDSTEIELIKGERVVLLEEVLDTESSGWSLIKRTRDRRTGYVPTDFLQKFDDDFSDYAEE